MAHAICDCMFEIERFKNPDTESTSVEEKTKMLKEHSEKIKMLEEHDEIIGGFKKWDTKVNILIYCIKLFVKSY